MAGVPHPWVHSLDEENNSLYKNTETGEVCREHPCDAVYRKVFYDTKALYDGSRESREKAHRLSSKLQLTTPRQSSNGTANMTAFGKEAWRQLAQDKALLPLSVAGPLPSPAFGTAAWQNIKMCS